MARAGAVHDHLADVENGHVVGHAHGRLDGLLDQEDAEVGLLQAATVSMTSATIEGARPAEGSSSISSDGRGIRAWPMASICCWPPERDPARVDDRWPRTGNSS